MWRGGCRCFVKLRLVGEIKVKLEGKVALYIQNHPLRLHNRKERGKNGGNPVDPENRLSRSGADILIYGPRADVLIHHLCTSHSLMHAYPLNHPVRFMQGMVYVFLVGNASMMDL